jgi:flagellar hook-basal body complex protein FliE
MAMNNINNLNNISTNDLFNNKSTNTNNNSNVNFADMLKKELEDTNKVMEAGQQANVEIATGTVKDLGKANIAIEKADLKMQMMLEVRNKAINAYKELSKIQI